MRFDWQNLKNEIRGLRSHNTKDFPHPTDPTKRIKIQYGGLLHAYTDKGFEDIERELPDYSFPEGKELKEQQLKHFVMSLPDWGEVKVEDGGKVVRVFDRKGVSIFKYSNPIAIEKGKAPFKVVKDGQKARDAFSAREDLADGERIVNSEAIDEGTYEVENGKLYIKLPAILKNRYPLQAYDATDTGSTNNADAWLSEANPDTNFGDKLNPYIRELSIAGTGRIVFDWTLSAGNGEISTIKLYLYVITLYGGFNFPVAVHELTQAFTEDGATWNKYDGSNAWTNPGGDYSGTIVDEVTVDTQAQWYAWVLSGAGSDNPIAGLTWESVVDLLLKEKTQRADTAKYFNINSKEKATKKPYIEITYTPAVTEKTSSDTGSGTDAYVSLEKGEAKSSSDAGSGAESTPVPSATLAGSETGSGIEAFVARLLAAFDAGTGAEVGGLLKDLFVSELGRGSDSLIAKIETPTKGGGMKLWT